MLEKTCTSINVFLYNYLQELEIDIEKENDIEIESDSVIRKEGAPRWNKTRDRIGTSCETGTATAREPCRSQAAGERGNNSVDREFRLDNEMTEL
ncbi:hypothetical protein EVAR_23575_1 [Eumeta japonica]|uniref:Uncharacterized protein n=1 Tax=Eumeta variegata TaxID=151549 RepID=A0A4C1WXY5_EUMVA|nr:hypothetical protein EVAR_23575_1 [Eumeta japonica]